MPIQVQNLAASRSSQCVLTTRFWLNSLMRASKVRGKKNKKKIVVVCASALRVGKRASVVNASKVTDSEHASAKSLTGM